MLTLTTLEIMAEVRAGDALHGVSTPVVAPVKNPPSADIPAVPDFGQVLTAFDLRPLLSRTVRGAHEPTVVRGVMAYVRDNVTLMGLSPIVGERSRGHSS